MFWKPACTDICKFGVSWGKNTLWSINVFNIHRKCCSACSMCHGLEEFIRYCKEVKKWTFTIWSQPTTVASECVSWLCLTGLWSSACRNRGPNPSASKSLEAALRSGCLGVGGARVTHPVKYWIINYRKNTKRRRSLARSAFEVHQVWWRGGKNKYEKKKYEKCALLWAVKFCSRLLRRIVPSEVICI